MIFYRIYIRIWILIIKYKEELGLKEGLIESAKIYRNYCNS
jgi:hypothetical protein